jgi:hypothetical protein
MEQTQKAQQSTDNGEKNGQPNMRLRLPDLPEYRLGVEGDLNGFDATDAEFLEFMQSLVPLTGEGLDHWTWEERRDFLNWCLDEQMLTIANGRLVPNEDPDEGTSIAQLSHDSEETGFLYDVERARPVIASNPEMSAKELAESLGLKSALYAQTVKVYVNAHKSEEEEHIHAE